MAMAKVAWETLMLTRPLLLVMVAATPMETTGRFWLSRMENLMPGLLVAASGRVVMLGPPTGMEDGVPVALGLVWRNSWCCR